MQSITTFAPLFEAGAWLTGLLVMAVSNPYAPPLFDLCLFSSLGIDFCPGEGLGHAIGFLARGEWARAIDMHWASPIVVVVLIQRSLFLLSTSITCRK